MRNSAIKTISLLTVIAVFGMALCPTDLHAETKKYTQADEGTPKNIPVTATAESSYRIALPALVNLEWKMTDGYTRQELEEKYDKKTIDYASCISGYPEMTDEQKAEARAQHRENYIVGKLANNVYAVAGDIDIDVTNINISPSKMLEIKRVESDSDYINEGGDKYPVLTGSTGTTLPIEDMYFWSGGTYHYLLTDKSETEKTAMCFPTGSSKEFKIGSYGTSYIVPYNTFNGAPNDATQDVYACDIRFAGHIEANQSLYKTQSQHGGHPEQITNDIAEVNLECHIRTKEMTQEESQRTLSADIYTGTIQYEWTIQDNPYWIADHPMNP